MTTDRVWAVIVARVGDGTKSRLADVLSPEQRQALALAMLADVVEVCVHASLAGTIAVVDLAAARAVVERAGAIVVADPQRVVGSAVSDMNAAVRAGLAAAQTRGATTAIVVPADVPLVTAGDFAQLLAAAGDAPRAVVVGAARDGQGTNALLLRPPAVVAPAFGPPSAARHLASGQRAGAHTARCIGLALAHDVDTPTDLAALPRARLPRHTAAALTAFPRQFQLAPFIAGA